jgi:hypothetical protein
VKVTRRIVIKIINHTYCIGVGTLVLAFLAAGCQPATDSTQVNVNAQGVGAANEQARQPTIEAASVSEGDGGYKLVNGEDFRLTVRAPGASAVKLYYQPVTAEDRALMLKTLDAPAGGDSFAADLKVPDDFNGEVWARVKYPDGELKETEHLLLAKSADTGRSAEQTQTRPETPSDTIADAKAGGTDTDESARSDKFTGGRLQHGELRPGDGDVRITVNVPAFTMTLWQGNKEIKTTFVGVGRKSYPIPVGMRSADKIILNPDWIPPNSEWVRKSSSVEPYERISADDPDNPLGKIKIPLGQAYLLHEAQSASDIGNLVSHGCVRVMRDDLFDVTSMIARARSLSVSAAEIASARKNSDRRVIDLNGDVPVDINYDTMVVEKGVLNIYPDVYERNVNTVANLRAKLEQFGVDVAKLDDATLQEMLGKVSSDERYAVPIAEIRNGNALKGDVEPLTPRQGKTAGKKSKK